MLNSQNRLYPTKGRKIIERERRELGRGVTGIALWALAVALLASLLSCGGPDPVAQVVIVTATYTPAQEPIVVTATYTPEPQIQVVTATFTPSPEIRVTSTPLPPIETLVPPPSAVEYVGYEHPSGAFDLDIPANADYEEDTDGVYVGYGDSLMMFFYTVLDAPATIDEIEGMVTYVVEEALIGEGLIDSYANLNMERNDVGDTVAVAFDATSEDIGDGEGSLILHQTGRTLYFLILLTPLYDDVEQVWQTALDTLRVAPMESAEPASTPVLPTPTSKPRPKPTATKQPAPPPKANKGCYLIVNELGVDLTITFTAQDRQWGETISLGPNASREYCLDPGRYTYTLDAPPPWGSTNGELTVSAGDYYRWPIQGG